MTDVVVVDDSPIVLRTLTMVLEREGFVIESAADGEVGIGIVADMQPAIVFLDAIMPGLDGYDVCRRIRELDHDHVGHQLTAMATTVTSSCWGSPAAWASTAASMPATTSAAGRPARRRTTA